MSPSPLQRLSFKECKRRLLNLKGILSKRYAYKGPDVAQIDLTDRCNSSCSVCWLHSPLKKAQQREGYELNLNIVKDAICDLASSGTKEIIFSGGGEPFLYPHIWGVIEHTQKQGLLFRINTNFTLLDKADIQRLLSFNKLASLTVSIWAGGAATYAAVHHRNPEDFSKLVQNLKIFNALRPRALEVKLCVVVTKANYKNLRSTVSLAEECRCSSLEFVIFDPMPGLTDTLLLNKEELDFLHKEFTYVRRHPKNIRIVNPGIFLSRISNPGACRGEYDTFIMDLPCYAGWFFLRIRANGDFNSCLKSHRLPLGNIYNDTFDCVWNGPKQQEFREKGLSLPRDKSYFRMMGSCDDDRGCRCMCDNIKVNAHIHSIMRSLFWLRN